jgi:hypothetical protein
LPATLVCSQAVPFESLFIILRNTESDLITDAEVVLSFCQSLVRGKMPPFAGLCVALWNAQSELVKDAEVILRARVALAGGGC